MFLFIGVNRKFDAQQWVRSSKLVPYSNAIVDAGAVGRGRRDDGMSKRHGWSGRWIDNRRHDIYEAAFDIQDSKYLLGRR